MGQAVGKTEQLRSGTHQAGTSQPASEASEGNTLPRPDNWWKSAVVYQIYPRSFQDSDGDGVGDIPGIISRLDHLQALGVDVLWLSPAYRSPQADNGYDISDYRDIDPIFGTLADLDRLIAELHQRGMRLVMDLVVNHTSDQHPWFQESRDPASDKADWYIWRPARPGFEPGTPGAEPTNWGAAFSFPAWTYDPARGEYYLHLFTPQQPDLNWENPAVRGAVYDMMNWWVARGVDGFRMDVINFISKRYPLKDVAVAPGERLGDPAAQVVDGPRMDEFFQEMDRAVFAGQNLLTVGETPGVTVDAARSYTDPAHHEIDMVFQFEHMSLDQQPGRDKWSSRPLSIPELKDNLNRWESGLEGCGWNSLYWDNHDQARIVSRWGDDSDQTRVVSAKTFGTVLHLLKGTPYVYQGEELGMTNAGFTSIEQYRDIEVLNHYRQAVAAGADPAALLVAYGRRSRDNARTPMQWNTTPNAGFTTGTPWIDVNPNFVTINAEAQLADPDSVFHHYRRLIALRHDDEVVREGVVEIWWPRDEQLFCFTRTLGEHRLLVVANLSGREARLPADAPDLGRAEPVLVTHPQRPADSPVLQAWESRVLRLS